MKCPYYNEDCPQCNPKQTMKKTGDQVVEASKTTQELIEEFIYSYTSAEVVDEARIKLIEVAAAAKRETLEEVKDCLKFMSCACSMKIERHFNQSQEA